MLMAGNRERNRRGGGRSARAPKAKPASAKVNRSLPIWLARGLALLLPLPLLVVVELGLRMGGYGYPTDFFIASEHNDQPVWIENARFGWRFFPRGIARAPRAQLIPRNKPEGTIRVFVFGESAAEGDPEPAYGFSRILRVLLEEQDPEQPYEVINVAMTAINSHAIRTIARQCAKMEGDFWIVYAGHNEAIGSFGPATVLGAKLPSLWLIRATLGLKATRIGQLIEQALAPSARATTWGGMEMFLEQRLHRDDPRLRAMYSNFERNLVAIARMGRRSGAQVLLSGIPANLADCPPFGSQTIPGLTKAQLADWRRHVDRGIELDGDGRIAEALDAFDEAAKIDPTHAELQYRLGRCLLALNRVAEARASFQHALDADTLRFRADRRLNEILARVAEREGYRFIDAGKALERDSPHGIPGETVFYEHVHLTITGNYRLGRTFAEAIVQDEARGSGSTPPDWLPLARCAELLAYTDWSERAIHQELLRRLARPPFIGQLDHPARMQRFQERLAELNAVMEPERLREVESVFRAALARAPSDPVLHEQFAAWFTEQQRWSEAMTHLEAVIALLPQSARTHVALGSLLVETGRPEEARARYEQALFWRPDFADAFHGLGLVELYTGDHAAAAARFSEAVGRDPAHANAYYNLGIALSHLGDLDQARLSYEQAVVIEPDHDKAHTNLGNLLVRQRQFSEALKHFSEAIRIQPHRAAYHNNLGTGLAQSGRIADAIGPYREAVRLNPGHLEARVNLGNAYLQTKQYDEALRQIRAALAIQPDFVPALRVLAKLAPGDAALLAPESH
jgi:tetratricopeptide (TPR) repeat protein